MIDWRGIFRGFAAFSYLGTAAALLLGTPAAAQQGAPPAVGFGVGLAQDPEGPRVTVVVPGATGSTLGVQPGDILLQVGGRAVTGPQVISEYVSGLKVGDNVTIVVRREGRTVELSGTAMPPQQGPPGGPSPDRSTPVQSDQLFETWNDRVSVSGPDGGSIEVEGWSMGPAMPLARSEHAVAQLDGKVWVLGGYPPGRLPTNLVQVYDPGTWRWTLGPTLPQPIHHMMTGTVAGRLYMIGGEIEGASTGNPPVFVANTWVHDPAVGGWVARAPMPTARSGGGSAVIDGKIYVAGGRPPGGSAFEVYDPATDTWEKLPDLPTQRNHLAMVALNGKIIVAGGRFGPGAGAERTDVVEIYDPATRTWTRGASMPAPRGGITAAAYAGCMFVFGGEGEPSHVLGLTPTAYAYDPRADRWTRLPDLPIPMHGLKGSAVVNGRIFLPGGAITIGGNTGTNAVQLYRPSMSCQ